MRHKASRGFTLVEMVVSLALGGLILTAIMSLFVGFVQVWQVKKTPYERFIEHVDNCTRFLYNRLNAFECMFGEKAQKGSKNGNAVSLEGFHCTQLFSNNALLNGPWFLGKFSGEQLPFFHSTSTATASVVYEVVLALTQKGLYLIFEFPEIVKQHLGEGVEYTHKTLQRYLMLSPYVTSLKYAHFNSDKGSWEFTASLEQYAQQFADKNFCQRPDGLQLNFKQGEFEAERFIFIRNDLCKKAPIPTQEKQAPKEKEKHASRK